MVPMTSRPSTAAPILAVLAIVLPLLLLGLYGASYLWLGEHFESDGKGYRAFKHGWQVRLFTPAAEVESWVMAVETETVRYPSPYPPSLH